MEAFKQCVRRQEKKNRKCAGSEALTGGNKPKKIHACKNAEDGRSKGKKGLRALRDCGLSEWVLCPTGTVETVQEAFQAGRLARMTCGSHGNRLLGGYGVYYLCQWNLLT